MSKVKDIKEHAHQVLKENIHRAEEVAQNFQSQLESEQKEVWDKRKDLLQDKIKNYQIKITEKEHELHNLKLNLLTTKQKLQDLGEMYGPHESYHTFNEMEAIGYDDIMDMDTVISQNETVDALEKKLTDSIQF